MKLSKTTLKKLTARYQSVLMKCFLLNITIFAFVPAANAADFTVETGETVVLSEKDDENGYHYVYYKKGTEDAVRMEAGDTLTVNGGALLIETSDGSDWIDVPGAITVNDGSLSATAGAGVVLAAYPSSINVTGGTIEDLYLVAETNLSVSGGTFTFSGRQHGAYIEGAGLSVDASEDSSTSGSLSISGGTLTFGQNTGITVLHEWGKVEEDEPEKNPSSYDGDITLSGGEITLNQNAQILRTDIYGKEGEVTLLKDEIDASVVAKFQTTSGDIEISGSTINMNGTSSITNHAYDGSVLMSSGILNVNGTNMINDYDGVSNVMGHTLALSGGTINLNGTLTADIVATGGEVNFQTAGAALKGKATGATLNFENAHVWSKAVGAFENLAAVNVKSGAALDIGTNNIAASAVDFADNSKLSFTVSGKENFGTISAADITIGDNTVLNLTLNSSVLKRDESREFAVLNGSVTGEFTALSENARYVFEKTATAGTYKITGKATAADIVYDAKGSANNAHTATAWDNMPLSGEGSHVAIANLLAGLSNNALDEAGKKAFKDALTALAPEAQPVVSVVSGESAKQVMGAVGTRLTRAASASAGAQSKGRNGGDYTVGSGSVWAQGLYNYAKLDKEEGFDSSSGGAAMGMDFAVSDSVKLGLGYAYTSTDVNGFNRDTDVDNHTGFVYGEYRPGKFFANATAAYGVGSYNEKKDVAGTKVSSKYDVDALAVQMMAGYDLGILAPEIGARYLSVKQDKYTDTAGQSVAENTSDTLTGVVGFNVGKDFRVDRITTLLPSLRLAAAYDFKTDKANSVVSLANGSVYSTSGENLEKFSVEAGAGIALIVDGRGEVSLNYEGKFRKDYQDHTGMINFKYSF